MRRLFFILLGVLIPIVAGANPYMLNPSSIVALGVVSFFALVVEAGVVSLLLTFTGLAPLKAFGAYFVTNLAVFM